MSTKFYRNNENKYRGKTELMMNNGMMLQFKTYSYEGRIISNAQACNIDKGFISFIIFQDFNKRIANVKTRSSVKAIESQHNSIDFDGILIQANAHYN